MIKTNLPLAKLIALACLLCMSLLGVGTAYGDECDGQYFDADDTYNEYPSVKPSREFLRTWKLATAGLSRYQLNLAVSYDSGYLVSKCHDMARYWYLKAAKSGNEYAKKHVKNYQTLWAMLDGAECLGTRCFSEGAGENKLAVLYADMRKNSHYFAPVTINGHTEIGLIDTGASAIAMSSESAKAFGINLADAREVESSTANGKITNLTVQVPVIDVAGIKLHNVRVGVGITGQMLIGMSFLKQMNVSMVDGILTMKKPD